MSKVLFYTYVILGTLFFAMAVYEFMQPRVTNYAVGYNLLIAIFLLYHAFRIYQTKKHQELM